MGYKDGCYIFAKKTKIDGLRLFEKIQLLIFYYGS